MIDKLAAILNQRSGRGLRDASVLIVGIAYKKNVERMFAKVRLLN